MHVLYNQILTLHFQDICARHRLTVRRGKIRLDVSASYGQTLTVQVKDRGFLQKVDQENLGEKFILYTDLDGRRR